MSISLLPTIANDIVFARNPVLYYLQSGPFPDTYAPVGAKAKIAAPGSDRFAAGDTMTITYTEADGTTESVVFTASATPALEDEIPDDSITYTSTNYWNEVKRIVGTHHRIAPFMTVERAGPLGGNSLTFIAIDTSADFEITVANTAGFTNTTTAPVADTTPENYQVLMEVYFEDTYQAGNWRLVAQLQNTPGNDGTTVFDLSSILDAECRAAMSEPAVPVWETTQAALANNQRRWYVRYTDRYGSPAVTQEWQYGDKRVAVNGGVSQALFAEGDFFEALDVDNALLTWQPDGRKIGVKHPEFLAWYNWDAEAHPVKVEMRWTNITNGVQSSITRHLDPFTVQPKEIALFPVSPTILGLDSNADAYKYQVRIAWQDHSLVWQPLSEWRTYYIDREYYPTERYVQYLNGFGVPECWRCVGEWGTKLSVQRSTAERPLLPGYNSFATETVQTTQSWDQELTYRTGYIDRAQAQVLQEMLIAGHVYDVSSEGYIPLRITTNSFNVTDTNEKLHAYQFTTAPRLDQRNYSKKRLTVIISGAWQEPGGEAWFDTFLVEWGLPT